MIQCNLITSVPIVYLTIIKNVKLTYVFHRVVYVNNVFGYLKKSIYSKFKNKTTVIPIKLVCIIAQQGKKEEIETKSLF